MNSKVVILPALIAGAGVLMYAQAPAPNKIGIINIQSAIISTKDGQKAANDLQTKFAPKKAEIDKKQNTIAQLQDQLRKGSNTLSDDAKQKLVQDIDQNTKSLNRETEDAQAELDQAQSKIMQELGSKMVKVISKYAQENGYSVILDVSSPQTPVLYAANGIDITSDIVAQYDKTQGAAGQTSAAPAAKPAAAKPPSAVSEPKTASVPAQKP